jgi:hypothetical protein
MMNLERSNEKEKVEFPILDLPEEFANDLERFVPIIQGRYEFCGGALLNIPESIKNKPLKESDVADFEISYSYQRKNKRQDGVYHLFNDQETTFCTPNKYYKLYKASNFDDNEKLTKNEIEKLTKDAWDSFRRGGDENSAEDIPYAIRHGSNTKGQPPADLEKNNVTRTI